MLFFIAIISIIAVILGYMLWLHSVRLTKKGSDVLIVLGYKCVENNIHPLLEERLNMAVRFSREYGCKKIILTGGKVSSTISEAEIMKTYLVKHGGIKEEDIILETEAKDTIENMINCKNILEKESAQTCTILSNSFHLRRIGFICNWIEFPARFYCSKNIISIIKQTRLALSEARIFYFTWKALKIRD